MVYLCEDAVSTGRRVALKTFKEARGKSLAEKESNWYRVLDAALDPSSRSFFPIRYDHSMDGTTPWIALELCGVSLLDSLRSHGPLIGSVLLGAALQLQTALQLLHGIDIIHLDVKPGNVLWDGVTKTVRLCDLGMAEKHNGDAPLTFDTYTTELYRPRLA